MNQSKLSAYLELARLSNIPTVFSNVLVGIALVAGAGPFPGSALAIALVTASLLYVGGMALNDLLDRHIDAAERPQRPIPSGRLSVREVATFTILCLSIPIAIVLLTVPKAVVPAIALAGAIVLYDVLHKRWAGSLVFMGLCRALVYVLAATIAWNLMDSPSQVGGVALFGTLLALYIIGLTVIAQKEVQGGLGFRRWLAVLMVFLPFVAVVAMGPHNPAWTLGTGVLLLVWLARSARYIRQEPPRVVPAVLGWLAGISLLDAFFLSFTQRPELALAAFGCFAVTVWGHRRIPGT